MKELTKAEEMILLSVIRLRYEAYGVNIKAHIEDQKKKKIDYGTLYSTFEQLVNKGYLTKTFGDSTPERGGKRKLYFQITESGIEMLKEALTFQKTVWHGINEDILNGAMNAEKNP